MTSPPNSLSSKSLKNLLHVTSNTVIALLPKSSSDIDTIEVTANLGSCPDNNEEACAPDCDCAKSDDEQLETETPTQCKKFKKDLENEVKFLTERFNLLLHNEQVRASHMLREAHRERQEKIQALQTQLECKNLSSLMYVVCMERRKSKLENLRLIEEYTSYILTLQDLLAEGQRLILYLSRGYKAAARVDDEWRQKMTSIIKQFQAFIHNYAGGEAETNQYFFNLPKLLQTEAPTKIDPDDDPCSCDEEEKEEKEVASEANLAPEEENASKDLWFNNLTGGNRPFVVFGDLSEFKPDERRDISKVIRAEKTAPRRWKKYVFNEMFIKPSDCPNLDSIKDEYPEHMVSNAAWNTCEQPISMVSESPIDSNRRRMTSLSVDAKNMGSILKIISTNHQIAQNNRTMILAARDSMELQSTTRLLNRQRNQKKNSIKETETKVIENLDIKKRRQSYFDELESILKYGDEEEDSVIALDNKSLANDSIVCLKPHEADPDKINFEKTCPAEICRRMHLDEFMQSLPPYMRANPFTHFEQTFEQYQPCSPEQLAILKKRIDDKKKKDIMSDRNRLSIDPLAEWEPKETGIATQTSFVSSINDIPCTCGDEQSNENSENIRVYNVKDLLPVKLALDRIKEKYMFNDDIEFNRFKIIGQSSKESMNRKNASPPDQKDFTTKRLEDIKKILKQHPSLLDIFQANTQC